MHCTKIVLNDGAHRLVSWLLKNLKCQALSAPLYFHHKFLLQWHMPLQILVLNNARYDILNN